MGKYKDKLIDSMESKIDPEDMPAYIVPWDEAEWVKGWEQWNQSTVDGTGITKQEQYVTNSSLCNHDWKIIQLFTSSVTECSKCGKER